MRNRFSHRYGYHPRAGKVIYEEAPKGLRNRFHNLVQDFLNGEIFSGGGDVYEYSARLLGWAIHQGTRSHYQACPQDLIRLFEELQWYEFFDVVEGIASIPQDVQLTEAYEACVNELLQEESVGWKLRRGELVRITSPQTDESIEEALSLLGDSRFAGPSTQFQKAIQFLSTRPSPDLENTVKEAVGAVEATARILTGNPNASLGEAVKLLVEKEIIQKPLNKVFDAMYGFGSQAPGVRHGMHEESNLAPF